MIKNWMTTNIGEFSINLTASDIEKILNSLNNEDLKDIIIEILENNVKVYVAIREYVERMNED